MENGQERKDTEDFYDGSAATVVSDDVLTACTTVDLHAGINSAASGFSVL